MCSVVVINALVLNVAVVTIQVKLVADVVTVVFNGSRQQYCFFSFFHVVKLTLDIRPHTATAA